MTKTMIETSITVMTVSAGRRLNRLRWRLGATNSPGIRLETPLGSLVRDLIPYMTSRVL